MTNVRIPPCNGCDRRREGCHGTCPNFAEWQEARRNVLERRMREHATEEACCDLQIGRAKRCEHAARRKSRKRRGGQK